ncbi:hypothetical protein GCM10028801_45510 [Nocardioides maradonensis]
MAGSDGDARPEASDEPGGDGTFGTEAPRTSQSRDPSHGTDGVRGESNDEEDVRGPSTDDADDDRTNGPGMGEAGASGRRVTRRTVRRNTTSEVIEETVNENIPLLAYLTEGELHPAPVG